MGLLSGKVCHKKARRGSLVMALDSVFVVYHNVIGDCGSIFTYAICSSERRARIAQRKVAGFKRGRHFFTEDPASNPYATEIRILKVQIDWLYDLGVLSLVNRRNLNALEVIS
jgi:hypothetical protein